MFVLLVATALSEPQTSDRVDGFDCIIDAVAGDYFKPGYESLTRGGRHRSHGDDVSQQKCDGNTKL
jgi:NADPH:quinone reductase-like Zn-dependent oxidoreductase